MTFNLHIVSSCEPGTRVPAPPQVFLTAEAADIFLERKLRAEWERLQPENADLQPLAYPGDWQSAHQILVDQDVNAEWGRWAISVPISSITVADPIVEKLIQAMGALVGDDRQTETMKSKWNWTDGSVAAAKVALEKARQAVASNLSTHPIQQDFRISLELALRTLRSVQPLVAQSPNKKTSSYFDAVIQRGEATLAKLQKKAGQDA